MATEFEVDVEVLATIRVTAEDADDAMDMAAAQAEIGLLDRVSHVRPIEATEA